MPLPTADAVVLNHIDRVSRGNVDMQISWVNEEYSLYCWECRTRRILPNVGTYLQDFYSISDLNIFCMEHSHREEEEYVPTTDTIEIMAEGDGRRFKELAETSMVTAVTKDKVYLDQESMRQIEAVQEFMTRNPHYPRTEEGQLNLIDWLEARYMKLTASSLQLAYDVIVDGKPELALSLPPMKPVNTVLMEYASDGVKLSELQQMLMLTQTVSIEALKTQGIGKIQPASIAIPEKTCYVDDIVPTHTERRIKDDD